MTRAHPNFHFESAGEPCSADPSAPSQVLRGAAGSQFQSACPVLRAGAPAVAYEPVAPRANPPAAAGNEYRFGAGPSRVSPPLDGSAYKFLKRSQIAQTAIDIIALAFLLLYVSVTAVALVAAVFILVFVRL